jgi:hypothetical protein
MRADLIMAWLQPQLARERPDTFKTTVLVAAFKNLAWTGRTIHEAVSYAGFWVTRSIRRRCEPAFR